jgi:RNA polymerase sigma-70 factor (ECF subfamily)
MSLSAKGVRGAVFGLTDEELMARLEQGEPHTLDELYRRYAKKLHAFCSSLTRATGHQDPEDLVHDVFIRVIKGARTFDPRRASFRTWLFRIARNRCIDACRRDRIIRFLSIGRTEGRAEGEQSLPEETLVDESENVEGAVMRTAVLEAVRDCIGELPNTDEKQAIVLYYLGGKVYREIAAVLGKSTSMARNHVKAAQEKVRRCLERKGVVLV